LRVDSHEDGELKMSAVAKHLMPEHDSEIAEAVRTELGVADWRQAKGWEKLAAIADVVLPKSLVVYTEAMSIDGSLVAVPADLTIHLTYKGAAGEQGDEFDQNFPALLRFEMVEDRAQLMAIEADLSPGEIA
jgi:hypothetical protein